MLMVKLASDDFLKQLVAPVISSDSPACSKDSLLREFEDVFTDQIESTE